MKDIVGLRPQRLFLVLDASPFPSAQAHMWERGEERKEKGEKNGSLSKGHGNPS